MERKLFPVWLKSHLDNKSFIDRFGADLEWAFVSNQQADNAAGKRVDWLREQPVYSTNRNINEWTDQRLFRIQEHLLPRITHILSVAAPKAKPMMGPTQATRQSFYVISGSRTHGTIGGLGVGRHGASIAVHDWLLDLSSL